MPKVLGLDLASVSGFAIMERGTKPIFGIWKAPIEDDGQYSKRYSELFKWLGEMRAVHNFDAIGYECPWMSPHDKMNTLRILTGFPVIVELFAGIHRLPCREVESRMAKKALTGDFFAHASGNRDQQKRNMVKAARELGWAVESHDMADAGAVAICIIEAIWPSKVAP
jgi:Holliday junction resolvasome RuvABC endonuclease subunit